MTGGRFWGGVRGRGWRFIDSESDGCGIGSIIVWTEGFAQRTGVLRAVGAAAFDIV